MAIDTRVVRGPDVQPYERPGGARVRLLDGAEYGFGHVSIITSEYPPDSVAADIKHRHPHISTIVITEGRGRFTIGDDTFEAAAGDFVVVPADAWHSFVNIGDGVLRVVGVHDSDRHATELPT